MGAFCCHGNQSLDPICPKTLCSLSPTPVVLHIKFDQDWPSRFRDIQVWKCGRRRRRWWTDDGPFVYYKLTLWAFGSGELIMKIASAHWDEMNCRILDLHHVPVEESMLLLLALRVLPQPYPVKILKSIYPAAKPRPYNYGDKLDQQMTQNNNSRQEYLRDHKTQRPDSFLLFFFFSFS